MDAEWINITPENLSREHLFCIIRSRTSHPGVEAKRQWLRGAGSKARRPVFRFSPFFSLVPREPSGVVPADGLAEQ